MRLGPEISCQNPDCFETKVQRLVAAVKNIGIDRLGEPNIRRMMNTLNVKSLKDIFNLEIHDIMKLEGFKEKSTKNLYNEIQTAKHVTDFQVLAALNINGIGKNVAKSILGEYTLSELRNLNKEQLAEINGIGPERGLLPWNRSWLLNLNFSMNYYPASTCNRPKAVPPMKHQRSASPEKCPKNEVTMKIWHRNMALNRQAPSTATWQSLSQSISPEVVANSQKPEKTAAK